MEYSQHIGIETWKKNFVTKTKLPLRESKRNRKSGTTNRKRPRDKDERRYKACRRQSFATNSRANAFDDELIGFDCGKNCKVSNGGTRGHNSFMFVSDVCCRERVRYITHTKQLLLAICQTQQI